MSPHVHIPTQQLQHTHHAESWKWGPHTVTGGCDTRGNASMAMYAKDNYKWRAIDIEKSSFNPLATSGKMAPECNRVNKRLAEKIAKKCREPYVSVMTYISLKTRWCLFYYQYSGGNRSAGVIMPPIEHSVLWHDTILIKRSVCHVTGMLLVA